LKSTHLIQHLLIIGANVRAAAFSAFRAGLQPWCADLFADADLERVCPVTRLTDAEYPDAIPSILENAPPGPWIFTGALENQPKLVQKLTEERPLWGNDSTVLDRVRRPWEVAACLRSAGLACPDVHRLADSMLLSQPKDCLEGSAQRRWLEKPLDGGGGRGIRFWRRTQEHLLQKGIYLQEFIEGEPCAAVYVAINQRAVLLGVTKQLVGQRWLQAAPFQYCGSVGPLSLDDAAQTAFSQIGDALVKEFGLRGLFGVDCVLRGGAPFPVEINPRYTASVEVLEHATGLVAMDWHRRAFTDEPVVFHAPQRAGGSVIGKAILYARQRLVMPPDGPWTASFDYLATDFRDFADISYVGELIDKGQPVISLFAQAATEAKCLVELQLRVRTLDRWLYGR
jgi:uncharacterized protein